MRASSASGLSGQRFDDHLGRGGQFGQGGFLGGGFAGLGIAVQRGPHPQRPPPWAPLRRADRAWRASPWPWRSPRRPCPRLARVGKVEAVGIELFLERVLDFLPLRRVRHLFGKFQRLGEPFHRVFPLPLVGRVVSQGRWLLPRVLGSASTDLPPSAAGSDTQQGHRLLMMRAANLSHRLQQRSGLAAQFALLTRRGRGRLRSVDLGRLERDGLIAFGRVSRVCNLSATIRLATGIPFRPPASA